MADGSVGLNGTLKHCANPLHIYCDFRKLGIEKKTAKKLCMFYEKTIFRPLLSSKSDGGNGRKMRKNLKDYISHVNFETHDSDFLGSGHDEHNAIYGY